MSRPNTTNRFRGKRSWKETNFLAKSERLPTRRRRGRERGYANRGVERTRMLNARGVARRTRQVSHAPASVKGNPRAPARSSKRQRKLELMEQARRAGWNGKTYHSAKKFDQWLSLIAKMQAEADAELAELEALERTA